MQDYFNGILYGVAIIIPVMIIYRKKFGLTMNEIPMIIIGAVLISIAFGKLAYNI